VEISHASSLYRIKNFEDIAQECAGSELYLITGVDEIFLGRITFWDASGQFFFEMTTNELPLTVLEKFIAAVKEHVPTE
jgi:hypothetical protein